MTSTPCALITISIAQPTSTSKGNPSPSSTAAWVGSDLCTFARTLYACACPVCGFDAAVAICGLGECSILQGSYPTVECGCNWAQGSSRAQIVCWMAWNWKARVVDRMPCTLLLMPYRAQTYILACWTLQKCLWNAVTLSAGSCHVCIVGPIPLSESVV